MPDNGIPQLAKLNTVLSRVNSILAEVIGIGPEFEAATALGNSIADAVLGVRGVVDLIKDDTGGLGTVIEDGLGPLTDTINAIQSKVSNIQWMLTGSLGFPDVVDNYPTLDLRPLINAVPGFAPDDGNLYQWLLFLAKTMVPNVETNHRYLGRVTTNITYPVPDCWGFEISLVETPTGHGFSTHENAPIGEWLARVSLGRGDYYDQERYIHHPKTYIPLNGFIPTNLAIEIRPGARLDVWAVMPVGYI